MTVSFVASLVDVFSIFNIVVVVYRVIFSSSSIKMSADEIRLLSDADAIGPTIWRKTGPDTFCRLKQKMFDGIARMCWLQINVLTFKRK